MKFGAERESCMVHGSADGIRRQNMQPPPHGANCSAVATVHRCAPRFNVKPLRMRARAAWKTKPTSAECSRKLKLRRIPCLSSETSGAGVPISVVASFPPSSSQSFTSVYVTPTVLRELPTASHPRLASPFHESESTSALRLAGE